jgi:hypothetical protein
MGSGAVVHSCGEHGTFVLTARHCVSSGFAWVRHFDSVSDDVRVWVYDAPGSPPDEEALDNLEELDFCDYWQLRSFPPAPPPASAFRFSDTLRVATFSKCKLMDRSVEGLQFPHLKQLALEDVSISEGSLHAMISSCPALECLLLNHSFGFSCVRISSSSLRSIGLGASRCGNQIQLREFIIIDAPCLERLLFLRQSVAVNVSVIRAPKLETLGCLTVINLTTAVRNVKILAVAPWPINLDMAIDLLKCFPCLEKLYIKVK